VSVVIPTYNRAYVLRDALESALAQTYRACEIIVVDDGSCDNTREIIKNVNNETIRYIRHDHNRGCSAAYNTGIMQAKGSFIAFLDSDDVWKENYLERQVDFLCRHPEVDVVFCNTEIMEPSKTITSLMSQLRAFPEWVRSQPEAVEYVISSRQMYLCLLEELPIKPTAVLVRRTMFDSVGLFDESFPSGTDWELLLRLSRLASFGYIDQVLATQRRTLDATHQMFREKDKLFLLKIFLKEKTSLIDDREALRGINSGICSHYNSLAWTYLNSGREKEALSVYFIGFKETLQPRLLRKFASAVLRIALQGICRRGTL
jgi:glycosyltransferase involved in cell wall biosynthesis